MFTSVTVGGSDNSAQLGIHVKNVTAAAVAIETKPPEAIHLQYPLGIEFGVGRVPINQTADLPLRTVRGDFLEAARVSGRIITAALRCKRRMFYVGGFTSPKFREYETKRAALGFSNQLDHSIERFRGSLVAIDAAAGWPLDSLPPYTCAILRAKGHNLVINGRPPKSYHHWRSFSAIWEDDAIRGLLAGTYGDGTSGEGMDIEDYDEPVFWLNNAPPSEWPNRPWADWNNPAIDKSKWTDPDKKAAWLEESKALAAKLGVTLIGAGVTLP